MSKVDEIMVLAHEYGIYYSAWDRLPNKGCKSALDEKSQELRNAIEALAQPAGEAEPVAVVCADFALHWAGTGPIAPICEKHGIKVGTKLYTTPQQPQPLTGEQAKNLCDSAGYTFATSEEKADFINGIRWGEIAHGIKKGGTE